jgi:hypothetical protein
MSFTMPSEIKGYLVKTRAESTLRKSGGNHKKTNQPAVYSNMNQGHDDVGEKDTAALLHAA